MNAYKLMAYCKYHWKAIGRHGAHSPSLFSFIEFAKKHPHDIENKLRLFFTTSTFIKKELFPSSINFNDIANDTLILIAAIHESKAHTNAWEQLKAHTKVRRSIDFFTFGVIFIKADYKQKEHFIVRI